jgi:hypothetical protein
VALSVYTCYYVTTTSLLTLPVHYEGIIAQWYDECSECKKNCDIVFMCELAVTLTLYRATISLSDADSHFFSKQKNSYSRNSLSVCTTAQEYIVRNIRLLNEKWRVKFKWNWSESNVEHCLCTCLKAYVHPEVGIWNFSQEEGKKNCIDFENYAQNSVFL